MIRKFPPQTGYTQPKIPPQLKNNGFPSYLMPQGYGAQAFNQQQGNMPTINTDVMSPADKREYYGDLLYTKITTNPQYQQYHE